MGRFGLTERKEGRERARIVPIFSAINRFFGILLQKFMSTEYDARLVSGLL